MSFGVGIPIRATMQVTLAARKSYSSFTISMNRFHLRLSIDRTDCALHRLSRLPFTN
jgi:hypothetical protein